MFHFTIEIFFITLINAIFPLNCATTDDAASAIASKNLSCSGKLSNNLVWSFDTPAVWIKVFPADEAQPIDNRNKLLLSPSLNLSFLFLFYNITDIIPHLIYYNISN